MMKKRKPQDAYSLEEKSRIKNEWWNSYGYPEPPNFSINLQRETIETVYNEHVESGTSGF